MSCYLLKKSGSVLDYKFDWSSFLGADTISTSIWSIDTGMVVDSDSNNDSTATAWLSGGDVGGVYTAVNIITTANGRTVHRALTIRVH